MTDEDIRAEIAALRRDVTAIQVRFADRPLPTTGAAVVAAFLPGEGMSPKQVRAKLMLAGREATLEAVQQTCHRLAKAGHLRRVGKGRYTLPEAEDVCPMPVGDGCGGGGG